jgi:hypothetical protein
MTFRATICSWVHLVDNRIGLNNHELIKGSYLVIVQEDDVRYLVHPKLLQLARFPNFIP